MTEAGSDTASDAVGESLGGTHVVKEARGESAAEDFVHHRDGEVVGIVAKYAEVDHGDGALVDVGFLHEVVAGLRWGELDVGVLRLWPFRPGVERLAQGGFHGGRVEVAADA